MGQVLKVHLVRAEDQGNMATACGRVGHLCRGFTPMPGMPGEYDTAICERIHATTYAEDVTCKRCIALTTNQQDQEA